MASIQIRIPDELKEQAEILFKEMGMSLPEATRLFLKQSINCGGLPFQPRAKQPNAETIAAFEEAKNPENLRSYSSVDEMFEDLGLNG